jgi:hypothetical protein
MDLVQLIGACVIKQSKCPTMRLRIDVIKVYNPAEVVIEISGDEVWH